ncbi:hypothetical protein GOP47_0002798 [Adiantum capillus-veneris]|uniref:MIF4G domain-containing protein n=1 Tax=Adiantum capillus-veneris TaxID=13818 RepID=A0A9D4VAS0_ADICA|nr:hypothetical protein GOP47_0002798 [Adiantum capillus-veneris]
MECEEDAMARQEEVRKHIEAKRALRLSNLSPERPDVSFLRTLDPSIKRNTAVIKKLKQINEELKDGLLEDLKAVNLSKFVSEAVAAICEAKLKSSDINAAVQICSILHQRYKDFSPTLLQGLLKTFFPGKTVEEPDGDKSYRALKKRSTLKLLVELYICGVFDDTSVFVSIIRDLCSTDVLRDRDNVQTNLTLLVSFARQGRVFLGLPLLGNDPQEELYKELNITADHKKLLKKLFQSFYDGVVDLLHSEHSTLRQLEHENMRMLNAKGELSEENASAYERLRKSYDQLFRSVSSLAEAIDLPAPVMPEDGHTTRVTTGEDGTSPLGGKDHPVPESVWDDEDTKSFYESLPDLRAFVPAVLLGESESKGGDQGSVQSKVLDHQDIRADVESPKAEGRVAHEVEEGIQENDTIQNSSSDEKGKERDIEKEQIRDSEKGKEKDADKKSDREIEKEKVKGLEGTNLDSILQRLPGSVSRDLIDQLTVDFCYVNSKSNRKKLVRALFGVPRTSLELLPYYSRMVATLATCMKDVAPALLQLLEEEFNMLINKKDQMNIETKIKNIRFIGELAKFKVALPGLLFSCLKCCLDDFSHHNIDVACNLLETCGRFLFRSPDTSMRMGNMLEIIMRLKNVKNLDVRHSTMVENAYYQCKPPERSARVSKVRPPLHQYIRKLLFLDLAEPSFDYVLRQLRKLPWSECEHYLLKCFLKVHKGKYSQVHLIASLTACLCRYHEAFSVGVVDEVLEEIRVGLEQNEYGMQQKRIAHMRFLGELYNFRLIDSSAIFDTLYLIIYFGYGTPEQDLLDPPEDCFRMRMIIVLLETCGQFFDRGSSKRKLDRFLMYFQRYVLSKGMIPLDVEFDLQDLFAKLRPKMARFSSFEEVNLAISEIEEQELKLEKVKVDVRHNLQDSVSGEVGGGAIGVPNGLSQPDQKLVMANGSLPGQNGVGVHDGEGETDSESGGSTENDNEEDEGDEDIEHDDDGEDDDDDEEGGDLLGSEEELQVKVRQKKVMEIDPEEEAEFERELRAVMQESIDSRKLEVRARPSLNMVIPMNLFEGSKEHNRSIEGESGDEQADGSDVTVHVIIKKGNRQQTKQLHIPRDSSLVQSTKQKEAAELEEKQDIKRRILEYNDREEDDNMSTSTQPINWAPPGMVVYRGPSHRNEWEGPSRMSNSRQRRPLADAKAPAKLKNQMPKHEWFYWLLSSMIGSVHNIEMELVHRHYSSYSVRY